MGDWNCPRQQIEMGGIEAISPTEGEMVLMEWGFYKACVSGTSGWADIEGTEGF